MAGVFFILVGGIAVAAVVCLGEYFAKQISKNIKKVRLAIVVSLSKFQISVGFHVRRILPSLCSHKRMHCVSSLQPYRLPVLTINPNMGI